MRIGSPSGSRSLVFAAALKLLLNTAIWAQTGELTQLRIVEPIPFQLSGNTRPLDPAGNFFVDVPVGAHSLAISAQSDRQSFLTNVVHVFARFGEPVEVGEERLLRDHVIRPEIASSMLMINLSSYQPLRVGRY